MARRIGGAGGGSDKGSGGTARKLVAAGAAATALAGMSSVSSGLSSVGGSGATSITRGISQLQKIKSVRAARRGDVAGTWRQLGMRGLKQVRRSSPGCVVHSFGEVQEFLLRNRCTGLDRALFAVADGKGGEILISVAWVRFRAPVTAVRFKRLIDVHGTGDIRPLAAGILGRAAIRFTGMHYASDRHSGGTVVVAESEARDGAADDSTLDTVAKIAPHFPRP